MKRMIVVMLLMLAVGSAHAYQTFTTPDGAFTGALLDGNITTTDLNVEQHTTAAPGTSSFRWQTYDPSTGFSVAMLEVVNPNNKPEDLEAAVNACRTTAGCTLLTDEHGTFNGFSGIQYSFTLTNNAGQLVRATARVWESGTGHTVYGYAVYEQDNAHDQTRVNSYLNTAVLPK